MQARILLARAQTDVGALMQKVVEQECQLAAQREFIMQRQDASISTPEAASMPTSRPAAGQPATAAAEGFLHGAAGPDQGDASSSNECEVCCTEPRDTALSCGHVTCARCSVLCTHCPFCRTSITQRLKIFM